MKKVLYLGLVSIALVLAGFNISEGGQSVEYQPEQQLTAKSSELVSGIDKVLTSLEDLKTVLERNPDETIQIKKVTKILAENWDEIEKQVEEKYPDDYKDIERSLYPLIAEAKKDTPNVVNMLQLVNETIKKVHVFKENVGTDSP